MYFKGNKLYT